MRQNILILNKFRIATNNYREWLGPEPRLSLITEQSAFEAGKTAERQHADFDEVVILDNYPSSWMVEYHASEMHARLPFSAIIAMSEFDLLRAARLRRQFGIDGQSVSSAEAYRDKLVMKDVLVRAGVPTVAHAPVRHATDIVAFIATHGLPIVLKPRLGAGSVGVVAISSDDELKEFIRTYPLPAGDSAADLLAERFMKHQLFHIDGIYLRQGPLLWPSHSTTCLNVRFGERQVSTMISRQHPLFDAICGIVTDATHALPTPEGSILHAEVFLSEDDGNLYINEIACRIGGGRIKDTIKATFGVDLVEAQVKSDFAVPHTIREIFACGPHRLGGWVSIPPKVGELTAIPPSCPIDGIVNYRADGKVGSTFSGAASCESRVASFIAASDSQEAVQLILSQACDWFDSNTRYANG